MKLTTTAGTTVDIPVSLPDVQFSAYLPHLDVVLGFTCQPRPRDKPEEAEPSVIDVLVSSWARAGFRGETPHVSPDDMFPDERAAHDAWVDALTPGVPCPFLLLHPDDAGAAAEAAGDALEYLAARLRAVRTEGEWAALRAIADMHAAEVSAWTAYQGLPERLRRATGHVRNTYTLRDPHDRDEWTHARYALHDYVHELAEQAQKWSEERAEDVAREAREARREALEARRTDAAIDAWKDAQ